MSREAAEEAELLSQEQASDEELPSEEELEEILPKVDLIETDGVPLESDWHRAAIALLIEVIDWLFRGRTDFYVGGNMFIYYCEEQARTRRYRGPDFFFVDGVNREPRRRYWVVWKEGGRYPDVIIELLSPRTAKRDRTTKKDLYEKVFRTCEYFCYDPSTQRLEGWRLGDGAYSDLIPNEKGHLYSKRLGVWLGTWVGKYLGSQEAWLRFFDADGRLLSTRAEAAEEELARLKLQLAEKGIDVA
jgi:Uma2 family endonuclease